ncbi:DUF6541 family protein [Gaiella sp.]|uniref:DUF6541 family protein n=1 Tax=Gaiella sp. TaxID=2663207 RepID=UPI003983D8E1
MSSVFLLLRLAAATALVLAPGAILARAVGVRSTSATVAWGLGVIFGAMGVVFLVHASLTLALVLLLVTALCAAPFARRRTTAPPIPGRLFVWGAGVVLGLLLWHVAGEIGGDGIFHLARVQKLVEFGDLSLSSVNEFADGGLHPGYAFPLWHAFLALVATVSFADPAEVVLHEPTVLAPLAVLVAYEAGYALFRRVTPAATAAAATVALVAMAPGHGGAYTALALPATASRQILVPVALALALSAMRTPSKGLLSSAGLASLALAVVHPTYAIFLWIPFGGFLLVRFVWRQDGVRSGALALGALLVPSGLFLIWLVPVIRSTESVSPDAAERMRAFRQYAGQLNGSVDHFSLAPQVFGRSGAVAVAALLLIPMTALAARRRWAAYVVGGSLAIFAITLVPWLFTPFADIVSLSQARRLAGFLPFAFALAGGMGVLVALVGRIAVPLAFGAGIVLQWLYPGDFGYTVEQGGPAWATWIAVAGALVALVVGIVRSRSVGTTAALASALVLLPTFVAGLTDWSPSPERRASPLTPGLVTFLREGVPAGDVVYSDLESSYRIGAAAPVYVCNSPPGHVADTKRNRPYARRAQWRRFNRTGELGIPKRCGAAWLVIDRDRFETSPSLEVVYRDGRYVVYHLPQ